jgi:hypothetical protein
MSGPRQNKKTNRELAAFTFSKIAELISVAQKGVLTGLFYKMSQNELDPKDFPVVGFLAFAHYTASLMAIWTGKPSTSAKNIATNVFDTAVLGTVTATMGSAIFIPNADLGAPNQFIWATGMGLMYLLAKQYGNFTAMSDDEFGKALTEMKKKNKAILLAKLTHAIIPFVEGMGVVALLSHTLKVGQSLSDATDKQITPLDAGLSNVIAAACAEQALTSFASVVLETRKLFQQLKQEQQTFLSSANIQEEAEYNALAAGADESDYQAPQLSTSLPQQSPSSPRRILNTLDSPDSLLTKEGSLARSRGLWNSESKDQPVDDVESGSKKSSSYRPGNTDSGSDSIV